MTFASDDNGLNIIVSMLMIAAGKIITSSNLALRTRLQLDLHLPRSEQLARVSAPGDQRNLHQPRHKSSRFLRRFETRTTRQMSSSQSQNMNLNYPLELLRYPSSSNPILLSWSAESLLNATKSMN